MCDPVVIQQDDVSEMNTVIQELLEFETEGCCSSRGILEPRRRRIDVEAHATLVDWIVEIVECFQLEDRVIFQSLSFLDRFLNKSVSPT